MKRDVLDRQEFRKYSLYGVGELVLIVIGIFIALQIDNWNSDKKQEESRGKVQTTSGLGPYDRRPADGRDAVA